MKRLLLGCERGSNIGGKKRQELGVKDTGTQRTKGWEVEKQKCRKQNKSKIQKNRLDGIYDLNKVFECFSYKIFPKLTSEGGGGSTLWYVTLP